jgi:hypothetical protein
MTLDFSRCKTAKDVEEVFNKNKSVIPSVSMIVSLLSQEEK